MPSRDRANTGFQSQICSHRVCVLELGEGVEREGWVGKARALRNRKA